MDESFVSNCLFFLANVMSSVISIFTGDVQSTSFLKEYQGLFDISFCTDASTFASFKIMIKVC